MPKKRQPQGIWQETRRRVLERDGYRCVRCMVEVAVETGHIDHIQSGKLGSNHIRNLRTLCRRCHVLRADPRHRGMVAPALRDGVIDHTWRSHVWEDEVNFNN